MATVIDFDQRCLYCHKDYEPNIAHHYCDDCVGICDTCGKLKGLWCFGFDFNSDAYKIWKQRGAPGILPKPGHLTTCTLCVRDADSPENRLREAVARLKPGQLELLLKSQKKEV